MEAWLERRLFLVPPGEPVCILEFGDPALRFLLAFRGDPLGAPDVDTLVRCSSLTERLFGAFPVFFLGARRPCVGIFI
jgi:hypothetical protein